MTCVNNKGNQITSKIFVDLNTILDMTCLSRSLMRNYAIAVSTKDAFCDSFLKRWGAGGLRESIFKTSASSFLV